MNTALCSGPHAMRQGRSARRRIAPAAAVALTLITAAPVFAAPLFDTPFLVSKLTGSVGNSLVVADFNNDANLDVLTDGAYLLPGRGDATLSPPTGLGSCGGGLVSADFNEDGLPDVAGVETTSNRVNLRFGNGAGGLGAATYLSTSTNPHALTTGDVNGDGHEDLLVGCYNTTGAFGTVAIFKGNGNGTFAARQDVSFAGWARFVAIADLNDDGFMDLVVATYNNSNLAVRLGAANDGYYTENDYGAGLNPVHVALGDLNWDGVVDVVVTCKGNNMVGVLIGNGNGSLQDTVYYTTGAGSSPVFAVVAPLDSDANADIAVACSGQARVSLFPGRGDGSLGPPVNYSVPGPWWLVCRDLDIDGRPDLIVGSVGWISVLRGKPDGTFGGSTQANLVVGSNSRAQVLTDLNHDTRLDLVGITNTSSLSVLLGNGDGSFSARTTFAGGAAPSALAVGDVNGDGEADIVTADYAAGNLFSVVPGNGDGTFGAATHFASNAPTGLTLGDLDGDGDLDVVGIRGANPSSLMIHLGNGDGTFQAAVEYAVLYQASSVALDDLDRDGLLDVIVLSRTTGSAVSIFPGLGDGSLGARIDRSVPGDPRIMKLADVNNDGFSDLVILNTPAVNVLMGRGDGTFGPQVNSAVPGSYPDLLIGDINGDGFVDLVTPDGWYGFDVQVGDGTGYFEFQSGYAVSNRSNHSFGAIGDLDGNGTPDLVLPELTSSGNGVTVLNPRLAISAVGDPPVGDAAGSLFVSPNPARGSVRLAVSLASRMPMTIELFDLAGRRIAVIANGSFSPGERVFTWNGRASNGASAIPGVYFARVSIGGSVSTRKFVLMR